MLFFYIFFFILLLYFFFFFFFFNDTATTEIYTLSLHDALPIGRPTWRAAQVTSANSGLNEPRVPKLPPTSCMTTRTLSSATPRILASSCFGRTAPPIPA